MITAIFAHDNYLYFIFKKLEAYEGLSEQQTHVLILMSFL